MNFDVMTRRVCFNFKAGFEEENEAEGFKEVGREGWTDGGEMDWDLRGV